MAGAWRPINTRVYAQKVNLDQTFGPSSVQKQIYLQVFEDIVFPKKLQAWFAKVCDIHPQSNPISYIYYQEIANLCRPLVAQTIKCLSAMWRPGFNPWVGKIPWRRKWQPIPVLLPGKFHGRRSLLGYRSRGCKESDTTEKLHFLFHFQETHTLR